MRHPRPTLSSLLLAAAPLQACGGDGARQLRIALQGADGIWRGADSASDRSYRAPAALPAQYPVAVSVRHRDPLDDIGGPVQPVANQTVIDPQAGCDWLLGVNSLAVNLEQDDQWSGSDDQGSARYAHRARVSDQRNGSIPTATASSPACRARHGCAGR